MGPPQPAVPHLTVPVPSGYPVDLVREARTRSGVVVLVRPILPGDAPRLVDFHTALSAQSVYLRFFSFHPALSPQEVDRFTNVDYLDRLALVVELEGRLAGVGRFERVGVTREAEVAFVVADAHQGEGIGTLLADGLAKAAWERGIVTFVAETLAENSEMLEVFRGLGFPVTSAFVRGVVRVRFPIEPAGPYLDALARREEGRSVASSSASHNGGAART